MKIEDVLDKIFRQLTPEEIKHFFGWLDETMPVTEYQGWCKSLERTRPELYKEAAKW